MKKIDEAREKEKMAAKVNPFSVSFLRPDLQLLILMILMNTLDKQRLYDNDWYSVWFCVSP